MFVGMAPALLRVVLSETRWLRFLLDLTYGKFCGDFRCACSSECMVDGTARPPVRLTSASAMEPVRTAEDP